MIHPADCAKLYFIQMGTHKLRVALCNREVYGHKYQH
jgi:hypothetical protein